MLIIEGYYFNGQNSKRVNAMLKSINSSKFSLFFDDSLSISPLLLDLAYSREFELEADRYAIDMLKASNIPVESFSIMIKYLAEYYDQDTLHNEPSTISGFLSTHPQLISV